LLTTEALISEIPEPKAAAPAGGGHGGGMDGMYYLPVPSQDQVATQAEKQSGVLPEFEVATIKPVPSNTPHSVGVTVYPGGRVVIKGISLKGLVQIAFHLSSWQISGGDQSLDGVPYDIEAKPPEAVPGGALNLRYSLFDIEDEHLRQMLQSLLVQRFQLKFHREEKTGNVYVLEQSGKTPPQLVAAKVKSKDANPQEDTSWSGDFDLVDGRWSFFNASMPQLAKFVSSYSVRRPVLDETGITGSYDYRSPSQVDPETQRNDFPGCILILVKELGLKLKPAKGPVDMLIIDHAEAPSPN
jgi:uncharacterized protein (TIGR03435 family)